MSTLVSAPPTAWRPISRFFRTPKGLLLIVLGLLAAIGAVVIGPQRAAPELATGVGVAALTDFALMLMFRSEITFPSGALLTGLIVALILSPTESLSTVGLTAMVAIASKYVFRTRWSNVFNPAALALVVAYFAFGSAESWWGALPDLPALGVVLLLALGFFLADRVNKVPMALAFLAGFYGLFTATAFLGNAASVLEVFRAPDLNAAVFFAVFMLDDPPTSPVRYREQVTFGLITALVSYALFMSAGAVYYLPAGVLVANLWESLRRVGERAGARPAERRTPRAAMAPRPTAT